MIRRKIVTGDVGHKSTLNSDPESQFNVTFRPWATFQRGILTHLHTFTHGIPTQEGVKIQQRAQNSTALEGHNSIKKTH